MSTELGPDFLQSLPHEQCNRIFSAQTRSQQHRNLPSVQVRAGAAGRGRMSHTNIPVEFMCSGSQHIDTGVSPYQQNLS